MEWDRVIMVAIYKGIALVGGTWSLGRCLDVRGAQRLSECRACRFWDWMQGMVAVEASHSFRVLVDRLILKV